LPVTKKLKLYRLYDYPGIIAKSADLFGSKLAGTDLLDAF
jgi:hypothetical protein